VRFEGFERISEVPPPREDDSVRASQANAPVRADSIFEHRREKQAPDDLIVSLHDATGVGLSLKEGSLHEAGDGLLTLASVGATFMNNPQWF
jgi:hypothetical protein